MARPLSVWGSRCGWRRSAAYAIWSGVGTALVALVGWAAFGQKLTLAGGAGIALIIAGVVVVQLNSTAH